jgi:hypothetical protein
VKDSDARGIILRRLYDLRDEKNHANEGDFEDLGVESATLGRLLEQLADKNLIRWNPIKGAMGVGYLALMARIAASGVDVIEGNIQPPISITVDSSINVHGSQGVQIGGQGNVQNLTMDVHKLMNVVDQGTGTIQEKEEAKSLLKKLFENPLVKGAIDWWVKSHTGV